MFEELVTVAVKVCAAHASRATVAGRMETAIADEGGGGADTVTVATAFRVASTELVATTWQVEPEPGAVYTPAADTEPPRPGPSCTVHVTEPFAVPVTWAPNRTTPSGATAASVGDTATTMACPAGAAAPFVSGADAPHAARKSAAMAATEPRASSHVGVPPPGKVWPLASRRKPLKRQGFLPSSPYRGASVAPKRTFTGGYQASRIPPDESLEAVSSPDAHTRPGPRDP